MGRNLLWSKILASFLPRQGAQVKPSKESLPRSEKQLLWPLGLTPPAAAPLAGSCLIGTKHQMPDWLTSMTI